MRKARGSVAMWLVAASLGIGLARAASTDVSARASDAREVLGDAARGSGLDLQAEREPTPTISLAALIGVQPGASVPITVPGRFTPGSSASIRRGPFTLADAEVTATAVHGTVSVPAGSLPAVGTLDVATPRKTAHGGGRVVFVAGRWTFDLQAPNGWRLAIVTDAVTPQNATNSLPIAAKFHKGTDAAPFETRKGQSSTDGDGKSISISLTEDLPGATPECDQVLARYQQIATDLAKKPSEKLMAEFEKLSDKFSACMEQQQKAVMDRMQKQQDPAFRAAEEAKKDEFGCTHVRIEAAADGTAKGVASCGKHVGQLALSGTVTHAEK